MTVVSSKDFNVNQEKYLELALNEEIIIKSGDNMFIVHNIEPDEIFEPDEDFYRSISMEELRKGVLEDVHQWYKEKNGSNSNTGSPTVS